MKPIREELGAELEDLRRGDRYRRVRRRDSPAGPRVLLDGRELLNFGSNDYLGLAGDPEVRAAAAAAAQEWGGGATGSRLTSGHLALHESLEAALASWKGAEDCLLFPSGYQAATAAIPALVGRGDLVLSDALNHACLIDGCRLSRAEVRVYRHAHPAHARELLADRAAFRRCLVVTDGVFSMDGDLVPLPELAALCEQYDAWMMVDDAHGSGVLGDTGAGTVEHFGLMGQVPIQMGTLSKALGSQGGFVAGCLELIDLLRNRARGFVFSTGLAPAAVGAALAALRVAEREPERRTCVRELSNRLRDGLRQRGIEVPGGQTPIVPVVVGTNEAALRVSAALEAAGIWAPAIRPPTVLEGTARLRISITAAHTDADVTALLNAYPEGSI